MAKNTKKCAANPKQNINAKTVKHTYIHQTTRKRIIFLFTEKARKRQQLANWFRFIMRRPFHGAYITPYSYTLPIVRVKSDIKSIFLSPKLPLLHRWPLLPLSSFQSRHVYLRQDHMQTRLHPSNPIRPSNLIHPLSFLSVHLH